MQAPTLGSSDALREAALRSEVRRACVVIAIALIMMALGALPTSSLGVDPRIRAAGISSLTVLIAIHAALIALARRALASGGSLPQVAVVSAVVVEALIPTTLLTWLVHHEFFTPWAAMGAPPIFGYAVILTLSTLRLRPAYCVLSGLLCAAGYGGLALYIRFGLGVHRANGGLPFAAYLNATVIIALIGLAAAWVARELRTHMAAALNEAATRSRLDRINNDLAVAKTIQQALLPRSTPDIPGYEVAGWNRSADQTGGDYYDWQRLGDGAWLVTLADVSGHGVGPAMVTAACRAYMRAGAHDHHELAELTSRANQLLAADLPDGRFITMAGVRIAAHGPLQLLSAGHGPIVLYLNASGETRELLPGDVPLAVLPDRTFGPPQEINLAPGDMIALVTDGFVEWARTPQPGRPRDDFGLERLRASLKRHAHLTPNEIIRAVAAEAEAFAQGEPQQDDLTMVIIRRSPA